jgi:diaminopimelate epimerase
MGDLGGDQLIIMRPPTQDGADIFMEIRNRDGGEVNACGNATRCVAWLWFREMGVESCVVETKADLLRCEKVGEDQVTVDMGEPKLEWKEIPLKEAMHTHHIDVKLGPIDNPVLHNPGAVNMGNPHCVFFVKDFTTAKPEKVGPMVEYFPLFPEQVNVSFALVESKTRVRLKVWERGVGMTQACGTAACATVVAGVRQKRLERETDVELDGGVLRIKWDEASNRVFMTGPVELESSESTYL